MKHFQLFEQFISEKVNLRYVEKIADELMDPIDVEFTRHFFDRLTRKEHEGAAEITNDDLINFFKRLAKDKDRFDRFISAYDEVIVNDRSSRINIPFKNEVDTIIAKTIMRKADFKAPEPKFKI
jgi:hypothetical protein